MLCRIFLTVTLFNPSHIQFFQVFCQNHGVANRLLLTPMHARVLLINMPVRFTFYACETIVTASESVLVVKHFLLVNVTAERSVLSSRMYAISVPDDSKAHQTQLGEDAPLA